MIRNSSKPVFDVNIVVRVNVCGLVCSLGKHLFTLLRMVAVILQNTLMMEW